MDHALVTQVELPERQETWIFPRFSVLLLQKANMLRHIKQELGSHTQISRFVLTCAIKIVSLDVTIFIFRSLLECFPE